MTGFSSSLFLFSFKVILGVLISCVSVLVVRDLMVQLSWIY